MAKIEQAVYKSLRYHNLVIYLVAFSFSPTATLNNKSEICSRLSLGRGTIPVIRNRMLKKRWRGTYIVWEGDIAQRLYYGDTTGQLD